jgi:hypothetical protein
MLSLIYSTPIGDQWEEGNKLERHKFAIRRIVIRAKKASRQLVVHAFYFTEYPP